MLERQLRKQSLDGGAWKRAVSFLLHPITVLCATAAHTWWAHEK